MILTRVQSFVGVLTQRVSGRIGARGWADSPLDPCVVAHTRSLIYRQIATLHLDTGTITFEENMIGESKSAGVPWLGQPFAKVPIINTFRHTDKNCTLDPFSVISMYKILLKNYSLRSFYFSLRASSIDTKHTFPCTSRSTSLIILTYESSSFTRMAILSNELERSVDEAARQESHRSNPRDPIPKKREILWSGIAYVLTAQLAKRSS